jgi:antitoxin component of RelBE/YafQ-DinJ toxin-antitoxin module
MAAKRSVGLRLSDATIRELESLAKKYSVSQSDVVAVLIRCVYNNGGIDEDELYELFELVSRC